MSVQPPPFFASVFARQQTRRRPARKGILVVHAILIVLTTFFALPLLLVLASSFSKESDLALYGYSLWPRHFTLDAYRFLFQDASIVVNGYGVTICVTVVGTFLSVLIMSLFAYVLARRDYRFQRLLTIFLVITMLFSGGLVSFFLVMTQLLHVQDTLLAYIVPFLVIPVNVLILRTHFKGLPIELIEAAKLDGAGEWHIFFKIIVPLSTPALATVSLLVSLAYWNDWFMGLIFITNPRLMSLQYLMYQIAQDMTLLQTTREVANITPPTLSVLMAMAVVTIGPILLIFPFIQRFLVRGLTLGGLK